MNDQGIEYDQLTGLYSRWQCYHEIQKILNDKLYRVYCSIDLHNFKRINAIYGTKKGDELLIAIADALRTAFPDGLIARLSGDEFGYILAPKVFNQYAMSGRAHSLFAALHDIHVDELEKEHLTFAVGAVYIDPDYFNNPDEVLFDGVVNRHKAKEHPGNFIWSDYGAVPDVEGCFIELSEDRILYNSLNNRLFSIHDENDWFKYLHDGASLKEDMFRRNVGNIDDIITYFKNKNIPDFEYECLYRLVVNYTVHLDAFMFEMLVNDILIPYFESLEPTDRERSYLGHLYMLMVDCLIAVLRMGDMSQIKRIRQFMQKARDTTRGFPHDSVYFEPYFYTLCEIVGHYESLQGILCDISYIDEAYEEFRQLLTGDYPFVVTNQDLFDYFSYLVDNARLFPIYRASYLLINRKSLTPKEQEEFHQRIKYINEHLVDGIYDLAADNQQQKIFTSFLQSLVLYDLSADELLERMINALHVIRTVGYEEVSESNIVVVAYLFLGASQALVHCSKSDEEKREIGIEGMEFLIEILRKRQTYANDSQVLFLIQVLMKSMFNSPVLSSALKYHYTKQTISAAMLDTYCHSKAVSSYVKVILSGIIDDKPELLVGENNPYQTIEDVKANKENLLAFAECACILHDIGKLNIMPITSNAYRRLTDQEFAFIRRHPAFGVSYLKADEDFDVFHPFVYQHHRWWNEEDGYPKVEENELPSKLKVLVDILSICDSLEAATSRIGRNYRTAKKFLQIIDEFISDSGTRYSADIVNFIIGNQHTYFQLRQMVDYNWQREYLGIFQEIVTKSESDFQYLKSHALPDLYANCHATSQNTDGRQTAIDYPEWLKSMSCEEHALYTNTLIEYNRLIVRYDNSVIFFYHVDTDRMGFLHPTPEGKAETIFINHFFSNRLNVVLSEEGYIKALSVIRRIITEPDFPKQGQEKLEDSDKSRCLMATYTSIMSKTGKVLTITGRVQNISLSTERLLQTIKNQNRYIEIIECICNVYITAVYSDIEFNHYEIIKGFPQLDEKVSSLRNTVELKHFVCDNMVDEGYKTSFLEFLDHTTLKERLKGNPYLILEYHSKFSGWLLLRMIPVKYDNSGNITHLILVCESTEAEHKQKNFLQYAASHDSLTDLLNRSHGEKLIREKIAKGGTQILAILDCDRFKQINDQLSHLVGDQVLKAQGQILKEFFSNGICMRLGGDEFVAYLNGDEAKRLINSFNGLQLHFGRLKEKLAGLRLDELDNIPPTMSMGVVYTNGSLENLDFDTLYNYADEALRQSKKYRRGSITINELNQRLNNFYNNGLLNHPSSFF